MSFTHREPTPQSRILPAVAAQLPEPMRWMPPAGGIACAGKAVGNHPVEARVMKIGTLAVDLAQGRFRASGPHPKVALRPASQAGSAPERQRTRRRKSRKRGRSALPCLAPGAQARIPEMPASGSWSRPIADRRPSTARSAALPSSALSLVKAVSIGLTSGLQGGRKRNTVRPHPAPGWLPPAPEVSIIPTTVRPQPGPSIAIATNANLHQHSN